MKLQDEYTFNAGITEVWDYIFAEGRLAVLIPGAESLRQIAQDEYEAVIPVNMLILKSELAARFKIVEENRPNFCHFKGGIAGSLGGGAINGKVRFEDLGDKTRANYEVNIELSGSLAKMGGRLLENSGKDKVRQRLKKIEDKIKTATTS